VAVVAEAVEVAEDGFVALGPRLAVVELEAMDAPAVFDVTSRL
jgi:hypothetical protein